MTQFQIAYSASQQVVGIFEGETPEDAIEAYAHDAGYGSYAALAAVTGTDPKDTSALIVTKLTQLQTAIASAIVDFRSDDDDAETVALNVNRRDGVWDVLLSTNGNYDYTILDSELDATQSDDALAAEIEEMIVKYWDEDWDDEVAEARREAERDEEEAEARRDRVHADYDYGNTHLDA